MTPMDRRSFLLGAFKYFKETETTVTEASAADAPVSAARAPFGIGRVADFPIGVEKPISSRSIIIESLPEGLRARSADDAIRCYALGIDEAGEIRLNPDEIWPPNRVFSILTCEPTTL